LKLDSCRILFQTVAHAVMPSSSRQWQSQLSIQA
jgi:hypothetical protein